MTKRTTRRVSITILVVMLLLFMSGCVVVLNNNFGHNIHTNKHNSIDDMGINKDYSASLKRK